MIVNPKVFNYKLTIGTLIVAFTILASYSYASYNSTKSNENFLKHENKLLESQIFEIISSYDKLGKVNQSLEFELGDIKNRIEITLDSLKELKADVSLIYKYRDELMYLKSQQNSLIKKGDSFFDINQELIKQNSSISEILEQQISLISILENEKEVLKINLDKGALISANSFKAKAYKLKSSGDIIETTKASNSSSIKVCFNIAENNLAIKQDLELYIQVIGPDNNVVADKGAITFNEQSLIYSSKIKVNYNNKVIEVCTNIETEESLQEGKYYITVFENKRRLGVTHLDLN